MRVPLSPGEVQCPHPQTGHSPPVTAPLIAPRTSLREALYRESDSVP